MHKPQFIFAKLNGRPQAIRVDTIDWFAPESRGRVKSFADFTLTKFRAAGDIYTVEMKPCDFMELLRSCGMEVDNRTKLRMGGTSPTTEPA